MTHGVPEKRGFAHLELSIERGSDPITGSLCADGSSPRRFSGWIELAAAIEQARARLADVRELPPAVA